MLSQQIDCNFFSHNIKFQSRNKAIHLKYNQRNLPHEDSSEFRFYNKHPFALLYNLIATKNPQESEIQEFLITEQPFIMIIANYGLILRNKHCFLSNTDFA